MQNASNAMMIFDRDPELAGFAYNEFSGRVCVTGKLPWRESGDLSDWSNHDFSMLELYLDSKYEIVKRTLIENAWSYAARKRSFHPVRQFLESVKWDGVPRAETLLITYMGAEDTPYVRTVTRKMLAAAVARIMRPGCKFDYTLILVGKQGIGKSWLFRKLGKGWFTDSLTNLGSKESAEQLRGRWIVELAELSAMRRADVEETKRFLTAQEDHYRPSYGRVAETYPRTCIFTGTANNRDFLKDPTGSRRFWPVEVSDERRTLGIADLTEGIVDQIWAEVMTFWETEPLFLDDEMAKIANEEREAFTEVDPLVGRIAEFLETKLPEDWEGYDQWKRVRFYEEGGITQDGSPGTVQRVKVCAAEIWRELLGERKDFPPYRSRQITNILDNMPGWERYKGSKTGKLRFGSYGPQVAYIRCGFERESE